MRDRNLEKNIQRVEGFVERWKQLSLFLDRGFQGQSFQVEEEAAFLELKSQIAQEHEILGTTLGTAMERDDKALRLLNAVPSLQAFKDLPDGTSKKIATEWHNTFIACQALLGRLKGREAQLAAISSLRVGWKRVIGHPVMVVFVTMAAFYGVYRFTYDWFPKIWELTERKQ